MRGQEKKQTSMLVLPSPEDFMPKQRPIRRIKKMADEILQSLWPTLEVMYAEGGRGAAYNLVRLAKLLPLPEPA